MRTVGSSTRSAGSASTRRRVAEGIGDAQRVDAAQRHDLARLRLLHLAALEPLRAHHLEHPSAAPLALPSQHDHRRIGAHPPALYPPDADRAHVGRVVQGAYLHLEGSPGIDRGRRRVRDDDFEKRVHAGSPAPLLRCMGVAAERGRVHHGEVELPLARPEPVEEVEGAVQHPLRAGAVAVHLVDGDDGVETPPERLLGHEAGLGHGALHRVHEQEHRIDHREHPFHLAAEVGVTGRVDDVDAPPPPVDRRGLGKDRDAALALEIVGVEHALDGRRVPSQGAAVLEEPVDEGRLAVIDVRDDGDVAHPGRRSLVAGGLSHAPASGASGRASTGKPGFGRLPPRRREAGAAAHPRSCAPSP